MQGRNTPHLKNSASGTTLLFPLDQKHVIKVCVAVVLLAAFLTVAYPRFLVRLFFLLANQIFDPNQLSRFKHGSLL